MKRGKGVLPLNLKFEGLIWNKKWSLLSCSARCFVIRNVLPEICGACVCATRSRRKQRIPYPAFLFEKVTPWNRPVKCKLNKKCIKHCCVSLLAQFTMEIMFISGLIRLRYNHPLPNVFKLFLLSLSDFM